MFGLNTFGDVTAEPDAWPLHQAEVLRNAAREAVLTDQVGVSDNAVKVEDRTAHGHIVPPFPKGWPYPKIGGQATIEDM
jgi:hypothetical protein